MGADVRRYFSLLARYFVQYAKVRLGYRGDFLLSVLTTVLATACGVATVLLIFRGVPRISGWSFTEILFLYGFSLLPLSLYNMISINLYYFNDYYIVMGKFDQVLLRPVNPLFQILFEKFRLEAVGDTVLGVFLIAACGRTLGLSLGWREWLVIALASLCGCVIYIAIFLMLTCVAFWMEDRVGVVPPVYNMLAFGRYPLDIYGQFIRFLLSWVIPFGFASFYPSAYLLRKDMGVYVYLLPVVASVFLAAAVAVWNRGVRNYTSTGS
jgi:ABC-2 type transport system permease protein